MSLELPKSSFIDSVVTVFGVYPLLWSAFSIFFIQFNRNLGDTPIERKLKETTLPFDELHLVSLREGKCSSHDEVRYQVFFLRITPSPQSHSILLHYNGAFSRFDVAIWAARVELVLIELQVHYQGTLSIAAYVSSCN